MSRRIAALAAAVALLLAGCARPAPTATISFIGTGTPDQTGVIVTIDIIFTAGTVNVGTTYPQEWVSPVPFHHHQITQVGTVLSYSFKVYPTEPGQRVACAILLNGNAAKPVDTHKATYPKPAVCSGPPV